MLYIVGAVVVIMILVMLGGQLQRQAMARGPRKGTDHLGKIRRKVRGRDGKR